MIQIFQLNAIASRTVDQLVGEASGLQQNLMILLATEAVMDQQSTSNQAIKQNERALSQRDYVASLDRLLDRQTGGRMEGQRSPEGQ